MAENECDHLNELSFGNSADVEDFRPVLVANCVFNSFLSYTTITLNIVTIHAILALVCLSNRSTFLLWSAG